jgi:hypothetical protein
MNVGVDGASQAIVFGAKSSPRFKKGMPGRNFHILDIGLAFSPCRAARNLSQLKRQFL